MADLYPQQICVRKGGVAVPGYREGTEGHLMRKAHALLLGRDRDARFAPTIDMRRAGGVLQRYR